jgi:hypothetical protein
MQQCTRRAASQEVKHEKGLATFTAVADSLIGATIVSDELTGVAQQRVTIARPLAGS